MYHIFHMKYSFTITIILSTFQANLKKNVECFNQKIKFTSSNLFATCYKFVANDNREGKETSSRVLFAQYFFF